MPRTRQRITVLAGAMRFVRAQRQFSQERLARAVGVTPGMIALIETGRRQPGADLLERIAETLEVEQDTIAFVEPDEVGAA